MMEWHPFPPASRRPPKEALLRVKCSPVHEGVGQALRSAYAAHACDMPADLARLLAKLG